MLIIPVIVFFAFLFPELFDAAGSPIPEYAPLLYPIIVASCLGTIPYVFSLYQTFLVLGMIRRNEMVSKRFQAAIRSVRYSAIIISVMFGICLPFVYVIADWTDVPGIMLIGIILEVVAIVVSLVCFLLERIVNDARKKLTAEKQTELTM